MREEGEKRACFIQVEGGEPYCVWMDGWMEDLKVKKNIGKRVGVRMTQERILSKRMDAQMDEWMKIRGGKDEA